MKKKKKNGMTMVEIMIVVAILGLLVSIGVPGYVRARDKARRDACINNLRMIEHAADQYRIDNNLSISEEVNIINLWPSASGTKNVSSYINKQLFCPATGAYAGGNNDNSIPGSGATRMEIQANGVPHCVESTTSTTITQNNTEYEHSIESQD